ncbi:MAG: 50S ribosomal protein L31 [Coriobacteriaceae bacterium]|nr:50S ribosomal protein L31 [Coriobacteriaceae bacterium]
MKPGIHPDYVECTVRCSCGNTFKTRSTKPEITVELCNECHPFYTGQQKFVDTGGRVQRFADKFGGAAQAALEREAAKKAERQKAAEEAAAKKAAEREAKAAEKAKRAAEYEKKAAAEAAKAEAEAETAAAETAEDAASAEEATEAAAE